ncbi:MAG: DNA polymerase III subunit gamma/tau [Bacteroidales bacterium]|nr:DNA polymerase III subunit gamma/tau [Bacteroidales bacterium]
MENYIVLARKYRPLSFETVIGQQTITQSLQNAIRTNHLAHAYLFCGPRGVGKTTCARIFAKTINCLQPTENHDACNQCESCVAFNEQRSFNIHELDAASNNSVEDIRQLIAEVRIPPQIGKYSVYIIDEVHMLSKDAFNALLKTLEEPPSYAIFILATTEKHKVLPTILSRCQTYDFSRITVNDTIRYLRYVADKEGINASDEVLNVIAQKADGGMRDALSVFDQIISYCGTDIDYQQVLEILNVLDTDYYFRMIDYALTNNYAEALLLFNDVLNKGFDAQNFTVGLGLHLRNVLVSKDAQTVSLMETSDAVRRHYAEQAQRCSLPFIFKGLELTNECDIQYRQAKNKRLTVELMLIKLCQLTMVAAPVVAPASVAPSPTAVQKTAAVSTAPQKPVAAQKPASVVSNTNTAPAPQQNRPRTVAPPVGAPASISIRQHVNPSPATPKETTTTQHTAAGTEPSETPDEPEHLAVTQQQLDQVWLTLPGIFEKEDRLKATLYNTNPLLQDGVQIVLALANRLQEQEVIRVKEQIVKHLRKQLHNTDVQLITRVDESLAKHSFTDKEAYDNLLKSNPELATLAANLKLTIE